MRAWVLSSAWASCAGLLAAQSAPSMPQLADYDVVWRTPSRDASGSMPIGNGEVGCNVWCEPDGRVRCYVSRTDAFSEAARLLKLGLITISVRPPEPGEVFEQRLRLEAGAIDFTFGAGERRLALRLFVDSEADVVHVVGESARDEVLTVAAETWRTAARRLAGEELQSSWTMHGAPADVVVEESGDQGVVPTLGELRLGFFHRNAHSVVPFTLRRQGLLAADEPAALDPLLHRAFGLLLGGAGLTAGHIRDALHPVALTPRGRRFALQIAAPCVQDADPAAWGRRATTLLAQADATAAAERTRRFWQSFWQRSYVFVAGDAAAGIPTNDHPLRLGVDSGGGNVFHGTIADVKVQAGGATVWERAAVTLPQHVAELRGRAFPGALRLEATVTQDPAHPIGRIVDKVTAGRGDGFLFDTHPGHALRLIVGDRQLVAEGALPAGAAHRVAATFDPASGRMALYRDGDLVAEDRGSGDPAPASRLTQALILQRWIQACGGRGQYPIKFNGSIFTVAPRYTGGQPFNADWRKWGDCFWWQNTRLPYYPMLAQGDLDMLDPLLRLYRATLPLAQARVQRWYDGRHQGAYWPETMTLFGSHANGDYGWQRQGQPASKVLCPWWEYARNQGLELLALVLDRWDYERDPQLVTRDLLPLAEPVLLWFATAYPRDANGTLQITPTQAVETYWHGVLDDMPTVAGLHWVLPRLLALPGVPAQLAARWRELLAALPPLPRRTQDGVTLLAPAAQFDPKRSNCESPELYAVFPFRHFGLGKPDLEVARAAYARRHDRFTNGWPQDGQDAALLGQLADARANLLAKVQNHHKAHRFPAMWGPNFDWCPDQDHGSNLLDTTHRMLLQCEGDVIHVLPCWPPEWDVTFRLHAPQRTVVQGVWRGGRLVQLEVTPPERARHVVVGPR